MRAHTIRKPGATTINDTTVDETAIQDCMYQYNKLLHLARGSIYAGKLVVEDYSKKYRQAAEPMIFIDWATKKSITLPDWMKELGSSKRNLRKLKTEERNKRWNERYLVLQKENLRKSKTWCANKMSKEKIAEGRKSETIRKALNNIK